MSIKTSSLSACRRFCGVALFAAVLHATATSADVLPDGRLDYGLEGLPIPPAPWRNGTSPRTVQLLGDAVSRAKTLADAVRYTREVAACELASSIAPLKNLMKDSRPEVRAEAIAGFSTLCRSRFTELKLRDAIASDKEIVAAVQAALSDSNASVRAAALNSLVAISGTSEPALERSLAKPEDAEVFRVALRLAATPQHAKAIAGVWSKLDARMQLVAAEALGRCGDAAHAPLAMPLLKGGIPEKVAGLHALGGMKATEERAAVEGALNDGVATVRREATLALAGVVDADSRRATALRMLKDTDPTVRQAAVTVLANVTTPEVLEPVAGQLGDEYKPLYDAAKSLLSTQKDAAVKQAAIALGAKLLENSSPRRQQDGSFILGAYRSDAALEKHIAIVEGSTAEKPDWQLIAQAADSLGRIGRAEAKPALARLSHEAKKAVKSGDGDYRSAVSYAIISSARLGDASVLPDCQVGTNGSAMTTPVDLRAAGCFGIGLIGSPATAGSLPGIIAGEMDPLEAKLEAVKAIGNLKSKGQLKALGHDKMLSHEMLWLAHWARNRSNGEDVPFEPDVVSWRADVSIMDITPKP